MTRHERIDGTERKVEPISAEELDRRFDDGEDVSAYFDWSAAHFPNRPMQSVTVDVPVWMVEQLDEEAQTRGVAREVLIKMWLADRLKAA